MKLRVCSLFMILFAALGLCWAQSATPATTLPKNPKDLMLLAVRVNGLGAADMKPWHLKANYQTFDADGNPKDQGIFEEWWASPTKYKISYTGQGFNQVRYQTINGQFMTGDKKSPPIGEVMVEWFLMHPLPPVSEIGKEKFSMRSTQDGSVPLDCVRQVPKTKSAIIPVFCFTRTEPAIRIEELHGGYAAYFNKIMESNSQYAPGEIQVKFIAKPILDANVTALEPLTPVKDSDFLPPAAALSASPVQQIIAPDSLPKHSRISGAVPGYPAIAKAAHVTGTVVIAVCISTAGDVSDARVFSGPPMLRQSALDAVKTWKFKPYLLNGQPVQVRTDIPVTFMMNR